MKRTAFVPVPLLLCASLALGLAGCDQASGNPRVGVALSSVDDSFLSTALRALEAEAQGKAQLSVLDSQNRQSIQNEQIDALFADKAKAVIVNPVDRSLIQPMVFRAKSANVPIVFFSRDPSDVDLNMWDKAYFVGVKTEDSEAMQVEMLTEYWKSHPEADKGRNGKLQYVLFRGDSNKQAAQTSAENRKKAFDRAGVRAVLVAEVSTDRTRLMAQNKMADLIKQGGIAHIDAVICENDDMALGVITALKVAGLYGKGDYLPIVGVDGTREALDAIADGSLLGTVGGDAAGLGRAAFDLAYALATQKDPKTAGWLLNDGKYVLVTYEKVTRENYKNYAK